MFNKLKDNNNWRKTFKNSSIKGYPIVRNYKFLGITIAPNFNLDEHFTNLKKKINYISHKSLTIPK